MSKLIVLLY